MDRSDFGSLFAGHGLRRTRQREEIYAALLATKDHPTAEEILVSVRRADPRISLATIYNTLDVFTRRGLCRRLSSPHAAVGGGTGGAFRYDADVSDHAHVVSLGGAVRDLPEDLGRAVLSLIPREVIERVERRMGVRVARVSVEFIEETGGPDEVSGSV